VFLGHFAVGFAAKRVSPGASLGTLLLAAQLADLVWPNLVLLGIERVEVRPGVTRVTPLDFVSYPWSHSLLALTLWAVLFATIYRAAARKGTTAAALTLAAVVLSHWVLDFVSHRPDMPLVPGAGPRVGLGLWDSLTATVAVEGGLLLAGVFVYARATRPRDRVGTLALGGLAGFLVLAYAASLLGPPPPSATVVAWSAQSLWLLVAWGYWTDRRRLPVREPGR
jgi:hypothetical protein